MTDPDAAPVFDRRTRRRFLLGLVGLAAAVAAAGGWAWVRGADRRRVLALYDIVANSGGRTGRPLTDAEFDEALALAGSPDPAARFAALNTAAKSAYRTVAPDGQVLPADRGGRVEAVALRRLDSPDPSDQANGLHALHLAARTGQLPRVRSFLTADDPLVRANATATVAFLERVRAATAGAADGR